jgi:hypothetical protein
MPNKGNSIGSNPSLKLKVVSLNLWHGGRLFDEVVAFLRAEAPDVVMLQEVYGGTDPELERRLRSGWIILIGISHQLLCRLWMTARLNRAMLC